MWETNENNIKDYYRLVPNPESQDEGAIELTGGPFAGLIYKYGDFRFAKPEELDETLKVEYEFEVLHIPEEIRDVDYPEDMKDSFDQLLLSVLVDMVQEESEKEVRERHGSTDGIDNTDESSEGRVLSEEDDPVSSE
jgi:hypothetical protein|tara:strand:- start:1104 stop:1514 length:411 start_codon:yes stop_codon:yes gene_type:complete